MHASEIRLWRKLLWLAFAAALSGCSDERPPPRGPLDSPANPPAAAGVRVSSLQPGEFVPTPERHSPYQGDPLALAEGFRLFQWFNCVGCHSFGGGGMGPALTDAKWIYGASPEQIYATIVQGRPNGMPSFGGKIPEDQVWKLVSYVRAIGRLEPLGQVNETLLQDPIGEPQAQGEEEPVEPVGSAAQ